MVAMILAAGLGTRLERLHLGVPKVLVDIGGIPLLTRQLDYVERQGVTRVVVNAHHMADKVVAFARSYAGLLEVHVVVEDRLLGTAGGVRNALDQLDADRFFVLYGDVLLDADLDEMRAMHRRSAAEATLAAYPSATVAGKGVLEIDGTGRVLRFAEKERVSGGGLVNAGLYLLESDFVARLAPRIELDFGHHVLPEAVDRGAKVFAYRLTRPVIDVGTPEGLAQARELARAHDTSGLS